MARLNALPSTSFRRSRWKNGGGETIEIAAFPEGVGFDAFAVRDDKDVIDALFGLHDFADGYQNSTVRTPWFRRRAAQD